MVDLQDQIQALKALGKKASRQLGSTGEPQQAHWLSQGVDPQSKGKAEVLAGHPPPPSKRPSRNKKCGAFPMSVQALLHGSARLADWEDFKPIFLNFCWQLARAANAPGCLTPSAYWSMKSVSQCYGCSTALPVLPITRVSSAGCGGSVGGISQSSKTPYIRKDNYS